MYLDAVTSQDGSTRLERTLAPVDEQNGLAGEKRLSSVMS